MARALVLIDVQRNKLEGPKPVPGAHDVRPRLQRMLDTARSKGVPVVHVQNETIEDDEDDFTGSDGWQLVFAPIDGEWVVRKTVGNAFQENPQLDDELRALGVTRLVLAGMQSQLCLRSTALGALNLGFDVDIASGAHATYDDHQRADVIESAVEKELSIEGADVVWWSSALA